MRIENDPCGRQENSTAEARSRAIPVPSSSRLSSGILVELHAAADLPHFWVALQRILHASVPYDALVVYLNFLDFATTWRAAHILTTANADRPTQWFDQRRTVDMTPGFVLAQPQRLKLYRLSDVIQDSDALHRTPFFRDFLAPGGWHHLAVALYWRGESVRSEVALRRTQAQGDFSAAEINILRELHPHIEKALNRLLAEEEERARRRQLEDFNHQLPFAHLLIDWDLKPAFVNQRAYELCAAWNFGADKARAYHARDVFHLPPDMAAACNRLKADWLGQSSRDRGPGIPAPIQVAHRQTGTLLATVSVHADRESPTAYPRFAIYVQELPASTKRRVSRPGLHDRLTPAERALVVELAQGLSNKEIARSLGKSTDTVKSQLTSIYRKLGVASRGQLLANLS